MEVRHFSSKDDRDYLLDYQGIDIGSIQKTELWGVPFENVTLDEAIAQILYLIEKKDRYHHILLLDPFKLMLMRKGKKLHRIAEKASLIYAEGGGLSWAAAKMGGEIKERIPTIALMMDLVRLAELKKYSVFLLGSQEEVVEKVFFNLSRHFPGLRIVGRHAGHMTNQRELMVKEAIRKTSPDVIFLAMDFPKQEKWIENNTGFFGKSIVIGVNGSFDILAGKRKKAPDYFKLRGLIWLWRSISRPWRLHRLFRIIQFYIYVFFNSLFRTQKES